MSLAYAATPEQSKRLAIDLIFSAGETVLPNARQSVAEKLSTRMAAIYSCEEVGTIATQCPLADSYHIVIENALVEILRDDGLPREAQSAPQGQER